MRPCMRASVTLQLLELNAPLRWIQPARTPWSCFRRGSHQERSQLVSLTGRCLVLLVLRRDLVPPAGSHIAYGTFLHASAWVYSLYIFLHAARKGRETRTVAVDRKTARFGPSDKFIGRAFMLRGRGGGKLEHLCGRASYRLLSAKGRILAAIAKCSLTINMLSNITKAS